MTAPRAIADLVEGFVTDAWPANASEPANLHKLVMAAAEKPLIEAVLLRTGGNQSRAALALGINRNTLRKLIRQYGIQGR